MENIIRVDLNDKPLGEIEKMEAHKLPILHRAFSVFLFDGTRMLIQKRAFGKYHSGELWANSCCSHPRPNKEFFESVRDRIEFELGISEQIPLKELFTFTYMTQYSESLFEYEYDHVVIGEYKEQEINFNPEEIAETKWIEISELKKQLLNSPQIFSSWFLICAPKVIEYIETKNAKNNFKL